MFSINFCPYFWGKNAVTYGAAMSISKMVTWGGLFNSRGGGLFHFLATYSSLVQPSRGNTTTSTSRKKHLLIICKFMQIRSCTQKDDVFSECGSY